MDYLIGFLLNILASYIYDKYIRKQDDQAPPILFVVNQPPKEMSRTRRNRSFEADQRAINRARLGRSTTLFLFFLFTFYVLWLAMYLPIMLFGSGLASDTLNLGEARFFGVFTHAQVPMSTVRIGTLVLATIFYIPVRILGDRILKSLAGWLDKYFELTFLNWIRLRLGVFAGLASVVAAVTVYLFTDFSFLMSVFTVIVGILLFIGFASSSDKR